MDSPFHRYSYRPTTEREAAVRKVVTIPVRFVGSDRDRSGAALRIQRVFRGYLVRKTFRKIAGIRAEVEQVEKSVREEAELLRKEERERLRVNERLMSLLLRLDSVPGVDPGIRELRRAVIKKAIAIQEAVDAIASSTTAPEPPKDNAEGATSGPENNAESATSGPENNAELEVGDRDRKQDEMQEEEEEQKVDGCGGAATERSEEDSSADPEQEDGVEEEQEEEEDEEEERDRDREAEEEERERKSRELVKRMMADNERMMGMMAELFERNEVQTRLLASLSQRVELIERAFLSERLRKKKSKAKRSAAVDDCCKKSDER